jgi:hypothetical protein
MISSVSKYPSKYTYSNKKKYNNWDDNDEEQEEDEEEVNNNNYNEEEQEEEINEDNDLNKESDYYFGNSTNKVSNSLRSINTLKDVNQKSESLKSMEKINGMNLQKIVNNKIKKIHDIVFEYKSINILIGRRRSGKTFNVCREVCNIFQLPQCAGFTSFVIFSDKPNESTINELLTLISMKVIKVDYDHAYDLLNEIMDGKTAYDKVIRENLDDNITDESKEKILNMTNLHILLFYLIIL